MQLLNKYASIKAYFGESGKLITYPGKRQKKKQALILQYLADQFESNCTYNESEINEILNQHHSFNDPASLRRFLIGMGLLLRTNDGRTYWKDRMANTDL